MHVTKLGINSIAWLVVAILAGMLFELSPLVKAPAGVIFLISMMGFVYPLVSRRISLKLAMGLSCFISAVAFVVAGGINATLSEFWSQRAIAVLAAPIYEEILKAGGFYLLVPKRGKLLKSRTAVVLCGLLAGLTFGILEGVFQPSIYRPITALLHGVQTMVFCMGIRFSVVRKGPRAGILAGLCMGGAILAHMAWNALVPLFLP
jgi:hypothetical protein